MSVYPPPNYTEPINVFNPINWEVEDTGTLTKAEADLLYLHYPVAQGLETLQDIVVNGNSTFNNPIDIVDAGDTTNLNMNGTTNAFTITNNVISGSIALKTKNSGGTITTPLSITSDIFNISSATSAIIGAGTNTMNISSTGITNTKPIILSGGVNTDRIINNVFYQLQDANALNTTTGQIYSATGVFNYDNDANGGTHNFATNNAGGVQTIPLQFNSNDLVIGTSNPPTCNASSSILLTDSSNKLPSTAWVSNKISGSIPSASVSTIVVNPTTSTPVNVSIPTNCIKFDIAVYGSGGLSTPAIYYPPANGQLAYTIQCGAGGGGGFARINGIYQPRQTTQYNNTLTITMTLGNGQFTLVQYNGVDLARVYNGTTTTATFLAGGAGCSTPPYVNSTYGTWTSSNGSNGQAGLDKAQATTPTNLQGGQNIGGGALVNSQMGVGQSYASYSSPLASWSASPIGYGGAVITFYT